MNITPSIYDPYASITSQIIYIRYFESEFNRETGINEKMEKLLLQTTNIGEYIIFQIVDAVKHIRDIRHGRGLKDLSYSMLFTIHAFYPEIAFQLLKSFVEIGCWKDVRNYANFIRMYGNDRDDSRIRSVLSLYNCQLAQDYNFWKTTEDRFKPANNLSRFVTDKEFNTSTFGADLNIHQFNLSFAAKYVPRETKDPAFFEILVSDFYASPASKKNKMIYRKMVSELNRTIDTVEIKQCAKTWSDIEPNRIPMCALHLKRDNLSKKTPLLTRYYEINDSINDVPQYFSKNPGKLIKQIMIYDSKKDVVNMNKLNQYWKNFIRQQTIMDYYIPILDLSMTMYIDNAKLCKGIASALCLAAKSHFGNKILIYSKNATWIDVEDCPLNIVLQNIMGVVHVIPGCLGYAMNLVLDAVKTAEMTPEDLDKIKMVLISNAELSNDEYQKMQELWKSVGSINGRNFEKIAL